MTLRVRSALGLGLAQLLAGASDTLAEKKQKPGKDKKAGYLYVTLDGDLLKLAVGTMLAVDAIGGFVD